MNTISLKYVASLKKNIVWSHWEGEAAQIQSRRNICLFPKQPAVKLAFWRLPNSERESILQPLINNQLGTVWINSLKAKTNKQVKSVSIASRNFQSNQEIFPDTPHIQKSHPQPYTHSKCPNINSPNQITSPTNKSSLLSTATQYHHQIWSRISSNHRRLSTSQRSDSLRGHTYAMQQQ